MPQNPNILVVTQAEISLTETFIRAHINQLDGTVFYLYGWDLEYKNKDGKSLLELYSPKERITDKILKLLPHHLYFKLNLRNQAKLTKEALIEQYIRDHKINVVLAEYGTSGSFITPICKALDIPLIVHFHGFDASRYDVLKKFETGYAAMFNYASRIIVVSKAMGLALQKLGCPSSKIALNTYGPHIDYTTINADYKSNYLISVGRHTYKKGPYLTILAFKEVLKTNPDLKLKMIGDGELFDVSKNLVKSLGLEKQIILLGGLGRHEIIKHLQTVFLFVQHSLVAYNGDCEGTPVGIIEAMAAGLPVVSTYHAGIPDVVEHGETGLLVQENDIKAMADAMIKMANNRKLVKEFGLRGKEKIAANYTMKNHIETINLIICEL